METIELVRLACYGINALVLFVLAGYFGLEYSRKKLRASLAWTLGFLLFGIVVVNLAFLATAGVTKPQVVLGAVLTASNMALLYYGASLLFFSEKSFFREKMTVAIFSLFLVITVFVVYLIPVEELAEKLRLPFTGLMALITAVIAILFYRVRTRLAIGDPRRRTVTYVSAAWAVITLWLFYIAMFWAVYPQIEAGVFLLGSFGFILLLYGMTTGRATKD